MVGTARRMGNHKVSTRHMTYLIEVLFDHLSDNEKADFSQQLNVLTSRVPGDDSPITLPGLGGLILPPVTGIVHHDHLRPNHPGLSPVRTRQSQYRDQVSVMAKSPGVPELRRSELEGREDQSDRMSHILLVSGLRGRLQLQGTLNTSILHRQNFYY